MRELVQEVFYFFASFFDRLANSFSSFFVFIELVMKIRKSMRNTLQGYD